MRKCKATKNIAKKFVSFAQMCSNFLLQNLSIYLLFTIILKCIMYDLFNINTLRVIYLKYVIRRIIC